MLEHFRQIHTLEWINNQTLFDEVFCVGTSLHVVWELECSSLDLLVGLLHLLRLEGWSTMQHSVEDYTDGPEVNFIAVTIRSVENFWSEVVRSPANCSFTLTLIENLRS